MAEGRRRASGFTLIELLVALALFSLVIVALSAGVRFAAHGMQALDRQSAMRDDLAPVQAAIRRLVTDARSIEGGRNRIRFVSVLPDAFERPGAFEVELSADDTRLVLRWSPVQRRETEQSQGDDSGVGGEVDLTRGVNNISFDYFVPRQNGPPEWTPSLRDARVVPLLIRVRVEFPPGDIRHWPDLVVAPAVDAPLASSG
jgi:general secretion pathway protein J